LFLLLGVVALKWAVDGKGAAEAAPKGNMYIVIIYAI